ncbi:hypothetical protein [Nocardioides daejeonensis]|uniref:hypothetical protein n=1 Tax=Nocardioides daejeonensis TaxID=1046556 RepID=UPI000D7489BE|nr:hypothetical protein [Nocardioides daejeonensis]
MFSVLGRPVIGAAALCSLLMLPIGVACDDGELAQSPVDLTVTVADWNGWDRNHEPTPQIHTLHGEVGQKLTVRLFSDDLTISVTKVDGEEITVRTSSDMAPDTGSGSDMVDLEDTYVITAGDPARFSTPTLDAGYHIEVRITE